MANFEFPSAEQLEQERRNSASFKEQVQGLLDKLHQEMVNRGPVQDVWGYLHFPPNTHQDVQEAVRDAVNAVNDGRDWEATITTSDGSPVLVVGKPQLSKN